MTWSINVVHALIFLLINASHLSSQFKDVELVCVQKPWINYIQVF